MQNASFTKGLARLAGLEKPKDGKPPTGKTIFGATAPAAPKRDISNAKPAKGMTGHKVSRSGGSSGSNSGGNGTGNTPAYNQNVNPLKEKETIRENNTRTDHKHTTTEKTINGNSSSNTQPSNPMSNLGNPKK